MAQTQLNRRLTTLDAAFLYFEKPKAPLHIGGCYVYEGHLSRADVVRILAERLHLLPRYRQKIVFSPFGVAHPTWEDDPDFDLERHVEELTLPVPGDDRILSEVGGQAFAPPLDRDRPLWKIVLIQGRADGNTAMILMTHHAMVDGLSGIDLIMVMHDLKPGAEPSPASDSGWQPQAVPSPLSLLQDAVRDQLTDTVKRWTDESFRLLRPAEVAAQAQRFNRIMMEAVPDLLQPTPRTPFNGVLSDQRQFVWAELPFGEIRFIRSSLGGTVNDVVLAIVAGGLSRYLRSHEYATTDIVLRAMCPVSMRRPDERGALGNQVSMLVAPLYVGIDDPIERLTAEQKAMQRLKQQDQAGSLYELTAMSDQLPPVWQALAGQLPAANMLMNTVSTNVPGPQIPLYLGGRKLRSLYPIGCLSANIGLFNAIVSYNQTLTIGATVDPVQMPDGWLYADCLRESFTELLAAAEQSASTTSQDTAAA